MAEDLRSGASAARGATGGQCGWRGGQAASGRQGGLLWDPVRAARGEKSEHGGPWPHSQAALQEVLSSSLVAGTPGARPLSLGRRQELPRWHRAGLGRLLRLLWRQVPRGGGPCLLTYWRLSPKASSNRGATLHTSSFPETARTCPAPHPAGASVPSHTPSLLLQEPVLGPPPSLSSSLALWTTSHPLYPQAGSIPPPPGSPLLTAPLSLPVPSSCGTSCQS